MEKMNLQMFAGEMNTVRQLCGSHPIRRASQMVKSISSGYSLDPHGMRCIAWGWTRSDHRLAMHPSN